MSDDEELSEDELNALLSDLESRSADSGGGASADVETGGPEDQDLEAFLQEADQQSSSGAATAVEDSSAEQVGPDLSDLDVGDELPAEAEQQTEPAETSGDKPAEVAESGSPEQPKKSAGEGTNWLAVGWAVAKWTAYLLPVAALWWVVGAYLGQWVSAGWLIMIMASVFVAGVPFGLYHAAKRRGRFRWWMAGVSLVLTIGLVAPLTGPASRALTHYGHWPATAVSEIAGLGQGVLVDANAKLGEWVGSRIDPNMPVEESARQLGFRGSTSEGTVGAP